MDTIKKKKNLLKLLVSASASVVGIFFFHVRFWVGVCFAFAFVLFFFLPCVLCLALYCVVSFFCLSICHLPPRAAVGCVCLSYPLHW